MATFTGTNADEIITPTFVSPTVTTSGGTLPSDAPDIIDAGGGNDMIDAGGGDDVILAGAGNDTVIGGRGNDTALLGSGNDTFIWNPGDGSDTVEGQGGFDTLLFNGANIAENIDISANGSRALFTRDVANIAMDLNGIERIQFNARGGADRITVNDLSGTDVKQVAVDLSAQPGSGTGDGAADTVTVNATPGNNHITLASNGASIEVNGLPAQVTVTGAEPGIDSLIINGLGGNDTIDASALNAGQIDLVINGGAGNDKITGSQGDDTFKYTFGVNGHDVINGFQAHGASGHGDTVALTGFADQSFDQLVANDHLIQSGHDALVSDGTNTVVTLRDVSVSSLHANDFLFS